MKFMHRTNIKKAFAFIIIVFSSINIFALDPVKIGLPMDVNSQTGDYYGYSYEYFQAISKYTGWIYSYAEGTSRDFINWFNKGAVDFIPEIYGIDNPKVLYSKYPAFEFEYHLFKKITNINIDQSDYSTLNGKKVGVVKDSFSEVCAEFFMKKNSINLELVGFNTVEEVNEEFFKENSTLDLLCTADYFVAGRKDVFSIEDIAQKDLYIVFPEEKRELFNEFNEAQKKLLSEKPNFLKDLKAKYYSFSNAVREENEDIQDWLHDNDSITIGYVDDWFPFCYTDKATGEVQGLLPEYIDKVLQNLYLSEIEVKYVPFGNYNLAINALKRYKIDMCFPLYGDYNEAEKHEIHKSDNIYEMTMDLIVEGTEDLQVANSIVCKDGIGVYKIYSEKNFPFINVKEVNFKSDSKYAKLIRNGKSAFLLSRINSEITTKQRDFKRFNKVELPEKCPVAFGIRRSDTGLLNLIDLGISEIEYGYVTSKLNEIVYVDKNYSLLDFLKDNMFILFLILLGFVLLIITGLIVYIKTIEQHKVNLMKSKKEVDAALLQAETANLSKSLFLNNMSHDIRTPMNAIIGFTHLAKKSLSDTEKTAEYLSKIEVSSNHLLDLINDVLDMSRIESGKLVFNVSNENLIEIANGMRTILQPDIERKRFDFILDTSTIKHPNVMCDRLRLNQILLNLLGNSVKFTPEEGRISLIMNELESSKPGFITIQIIVSDTGIGMSQEFLEHIFEAFEREQTSTISKIQGTGLGMAITKRIVEMLNGTIAVESEKGKGSKFTICIDFEISSIEGISDASKNKNVDEKGLDTSVFKGKRILLAEDNELNQEIARTVLEELGFTVFVAYDGELAYKMIKECEPDTFNLILMDIQMPVMNGYEATCAIRELDDERACIPIIAMTANAFDEDKQMTQDAGMDGHISKPFAIEQLVRTLLEFIK